MTTPTAISPGTSALDDAKFALRHLFVRAGLFSFFVNILMLTGPIYMLQMYDRVLSSRSVETLIVITILTLVLFMALGLLDFARNALLSRSGAKFEDRLKANIFDISVEAARSGAKGADQAMKDLRQVRQFVASPALTAVFDAPWTPIFLIVVFLMHWLLGLVALGGLILLVCLAMLNERASRAAMQNAHTVLNDADRLAGSTMRNAAAADSMGMRGPLREKWMQLSAAASDQNVIATDTIGGLTAASKASRLFLQSAMLGTGALLAIGGHVTPGVMIAASILTGRVLAPIEMVTSQWRNFSQTIAAYRRLEKIIDVAPSTQERTSLPAPTGEIFVDRFYCQPGNAKKPVLKNISFRVRAGETIGIVGPSAAGKSTLARALVGVEKINAGDIRLDGASLSQWQRDALGPHIGFLPQEVELFAGTPAQNISRFAKDADAEKIIAAATVAGAHEMILGFDDGYDTEIGEGGAHISAGQRQRLGLARALFGAPSIVVLDEPNANLDSEGDMALANAVQALKAKGVTTLIVAHRPSAIAYVDKLLLLIDGEARAFGPRDEILKQIAPNQVAPFPAQGPKGGASGVA